MRSISSLWRKLREKAYREEFVASQVRMAIPFQIRALMRKKRISQQQLAERSGLTQGVISRAANPAYGKMTLNTVIRVAAGLDVAFIGVFVPFSKLVEFYEKLSEEHLAEVETFSEEDTKAESADSAAASTHVVRRAYVVTGNEGTEMMRQGTFQTNLGLMSLGQVNPGDTVVFTVKSNDPYFTLDIVPFNQAAPSRALPFKNEQPTEQELERASLKLSPKNDKRKRIADEMQKSRELMEVA